MDETFIGEIIPVAFDFAPRGWFQCNGALLSIAQNQALFSLLGTTYGGDGRTTFALPDLRGRSIIHAGIGQGLSSYVEGQIGGAETVTLNINQMPAHNHGASMPVTAQAANADTPAAGVSPAMAEDANRNPYNLYGPHDATTVMPASLAVAGTNTPHGNIQPSLVINYIICSSGIYPSRP